jgi:hypothetical protein
MSRSRHDESLRPTPGRGGSERPGPTASPRDARTRDSKTFYSLRGQRFCVNSSQSELLQELGAFRTVTAASLQNHVYHGDGKRFAKDLHSLRDQGLLTVRPSSRVNGGYLSLTKAGRNLTETNLRANPDQVIYAGIVNKRELGHNAAIYDMYRQEAQAICRSGGTPKRVVLDFELKKHVNSQLAKIQHLSRVEQEPRRHEIARAHGLKVVGGHVQFPDVRIEFESRDQEKCTVDLECVTRHYRAGAVAAKSAAGFKLYNQDYRGKSAERGQDLVGEVLSL